VVGHFLFLPSFDPGLGDLLSGCLELPQSPDLGSADIESKRVVSKNVIRTTCEWWENPHTKTNPASDSDAKIPEPLTGEFSTGVGISARSRTIEDRLGLDLNFRTRLYIHTV
jgi:hypothetical protein